MSQTNYSSTLEPWAIYRWISPTYFECLGRYKKRQDAEGHIKILRRQCPGRYEIVFDIKPGKGVR